MAKQPDPPDSRPDLLQTPDQAEHASPVTTTPHSAIGVSSSASTTDTVEQAALEQSRSGDTSEQVLAAKQPLDEVPEAVDAGAQIAALETLRQTADECHELESAAYLPVEEPGVVIGSTDCPRPPDEPPPLLPTASSNHTASLGDKDDVVANTLPDPEQLRVSGNCVEEAHFTALDIDVPWKRQTSKDLPVNKLTWLLSAYCKRLVQRPCLFIAAYLAGLVVLSAVTYDPLNLDTDFSSFIQADGHAMRNREAYLVALSTLTVSEARRLQEIPLYSDMNSNDDDFWAPAVEGELQDAAPTEDADFEDSRSLVAADWASDAARRQSRRLATHTVFTYIGRELEIIYLPKDGSNALDEKVLREIQEFELRLRNGPKFKAGCAELVHEKWQFLCNPGETITRVAFASSEPSLNTSAWSTVRFDANGQDPIPPSVFLDYMQRKQGTNENYNLLRYFPKDFSVPELGSEDSGFESTPAIRSKFMFKLLTGTTKTKSSQRSVKAGKAKAQFKEMMINEVYPLLMEVTDEYKYMRPVFAGDDISSHELMSTLLHDGLWAVGSIVAVTAYIWFHTRSLMLSFSLFGTIFASVPIAYVLMPEVKMTIASLLSLFLIIGIGSDSIFVFFDFWNQSAEEGKAVDERLAWMLLHAGKSCLATSMTTSVSFFANLVSALQPLREFGLFMGLCVMSAFVLVMLFFPPLVVIHERRQKKRSKAAIARKVFDISSGDTGALVLEAQQKANKPPDHRRMFKLYTCIAACPCVIVCIIGILIVGSVIGVVKNAELDQGLPQIFPDDHNQVIWAEERSQFSTMKLVKQVPELEGLFCGPDGEPTSADLCGFHWCYAEPDYSRMGSTSGNVQASCWHGPAKTPTSEDHPISDCDQIIIRQFLEAQFVPSTSAWTDLETDVLGGLLINSSSFTHFTDPGGPLREVSPLAMEDWRSGTVQVKRYWRSDVVVEMPNFAVNKSRGENVTVCQMSTVCYTEALQCEMPGWSSLGNKSITNIGAEAGRRLTGSMSTDLASPASSRWLQQGLVPQRNRVDVTVIWGVRAPQFTPLVGQLPEKWRYDPDFYPQDPWAQRAMLNLCSDVPDGLLVIPSSNSPSTRCWVSRFRDWLKVKDEKFPARDFDTHIAEYYRADIKIQRDLWLVDWKLKAAKVSFDTNVAKTTAASKGNLVMAQWNEYLDAQNALSSTTANSAWHSASLWVRVEAEAAIIGSTMDTIIISALCSWLGMQIFTGDPFISVLAVILVLGIITCLAFFMTCMMGWLIGPIEVISLVIFMGYSVTYTLHIAHNYAESRTKDPQTLLDDLRKMHHARAALMARKHPDELPKQNSWSKDDEDLDEDGEQVSETGRSFEKELRQARAWAAMQRVGAATLSSAVSTIASSMFLLNCTLTIFGKLGAVVMAVTFLSIMFALIALPALLILVGPGRDPCHRRVPRQMMESANRYIKRSAGHREDSENSEEERDDRPFVGGSPFDA